MTRNKHLRGGKQRGFTFIVHLADEDDVSVSVHSNFTGIETFELPKLDRVDNVASVHREVIVTRLLCNHRA